MFKNPFGLEGRIRRSEYFVSWIFYAIYVGLIEVIGSNILSEGLHMSFTLICGFLPGLYFIIAQGVKRSHDLGHSGWFLFIPLYYIFLFIDDSQPGANKYGAYPKPELKPGMRVRITSKKPKDIHKDEYTIEWEDKKNPYLGKVSEIIEVDEDGDFKLKIDKGENIWAKAWVTRYYGRR